MKIRVSYLTGLNPSGHAEGSFWCLKEWNMVSKIDRAFNYRFHAWMQAGLHPEVGAHGHVLKRMSALRSHHRLRY
jgi:hypothetical protein